MLETAAPAVTEAAPAVATPERPAAAESSADRHADFLPSGKHYRLTGELPAESETPDETARAASSARTKESGSKADGDDTAAASEAASGQKTQQRTPQASENRWAKITRENRELREKLAKAEESRTGARETPQVSQPATEAAKPAEKLVEPKIDDVDPITHKAKYASFDDYLAAVRKFDRDSLLAELKADQSKTEQQRAASENERIIEQTVHERVEKTRKAHQDYDETIGSALAEKDQHGQELLFFTKGSPIDGFFLDSDLGHEVLYHVAKNLDTYKHIFAREANGRYKLNPVRQLRELAKIEAKLESSSSSSSSSARGSSDAGKDAGASSGKPVSQAPRPPRQTSGTGAVQADSIETAVKEADQDTYMREQNRRDLERRKRGK